jgi:protein NRD1
MLSSIKEKLDAPKPNSKQPSRTCTCGLCKNSMVSVWESNKIAILDIQSTTPEGTPSPDVVMGGQQQTNPNPSAPAQQNTSAILAALANMAKQSSSAPTAPGLPAQASMHNLLGQQNGQPQPPPPSVDQAQSATNGQAVNPLGALFAGMTGMSNGGQGMNQNQNQNPMTAQPNPLAALLPQMQSQAQVPVPHAMPQNTAPVSPDVQTQLQLIQLLAAQGIPPNQWATALQLLNPNGPKLDAAGMPNFAQPPQAGGWGGRNDGRSRDLDGQDYVRSPPYGGRRRSRSPNWDRRHEVSPPRRRDSPVYGEYHGDSPGRNRGDRDRGGRRDYRQRSPPGRRRRSPSPPPQALPPPGQKNIQWENLGKGMIKVLSRTLFVGGVTSSEAHLRSLFSVYGIVQTCIVNTDKRHAFVKMINRQDAVKAREGMEQFKSGDMQLRTRWGVGFGPRDCSDYQTGISIIPIDRLTDADRKWMLTAEYGGTGNRPIESGMVVEEPDIEIGAGVSSKGKPLLLISPFHCTKSPSFPSFLFIPCTASSHALFCLQL